MPNISHSRIALCFPSEAELLFLSRLYCLWRFPWKLLLCIQWSLLALLMFEGQGKTLQEFIHNHVSHSPHSRNYETTSLNVSDRRGNFSFSTVLFNSGWNESESRSVLSDSLQPHGLYSPWNSLGHNTGVGSLSFLQGNLPNPGLLHCRQILYQLSHKGSPRILEWVVPIPSSTDLPDPGIKPGSPALQANSSPAGPQGTQARLLFKNP